MKTLRLLSRTTQLILKRNYNANEISTQFDKVFPTLVTQITQDTQYKDVPLVADRFKKCLEYTVPHGKRNRGLAVPEIYQILTPASEHTEENLNKAFVLGWCVELLQAFFLVADDIMDGSKTRRGLPCWYLQPEIGLDAFNDSILLENSIYSLISSHFKTEESHKLQSEFRRVTMHTAYGQALDLMTAKTSDIEQFDMKRYKAIVKYKTAYYTFHLPAQLAMIIANVQDEGAEKVLLEIGEFFQIQDDFLDCFGDPEVTGKVGTDIQDGKCSWLVVKALEKVNSEQLTRLKNAYGKSDEGEIAKVREIYDQLKIREEYKTYEEETYEKIMKKIEQMQLPALVFTNFLDKIYKRNH